MWPFLDFIGLSKIFHLTFSVFYYGKTQTDFLTNPVLFLRCNLCPKLPPYHWTRNAFLTPRVTSFKRDSLPSASEEQIPYGVSSLCFPYFLRYIGGLGINKPPAVCKTWVQSLDWEDPLEEGMATHSSILAWRIPWTEEPGGLQSMGSQRVRHD